MAAMKTVVEFAEKAAEATATVAGKLLRSTGKAAWLVGTTGIVLAVPLIFAMNQELMQVEYEAALEAEQRTLLGAL
uniref:Mitochondrial import receptor subunit TOM22 n=1 Tax=Oryza punctata TaxID=4537 RepID=A0A0E0ME52_ORYPU